MYNYNLDILIAIALQLAKLTRQKSTEVKVENHILRCLNVNTVKAGARGQAHGNDVLLNLFTTTLKEEKKTDSCVPHLMQ